jgi:hypothetical protein
VGVEKDQDLLSQQQQQTHSQRLEKLVEIQGAVAVGVKLLEGRLVLLDLAGQVE